MLEVLIPATERFNSETMRFETLTEDHVLHLEHSLYSLSKWEQKWRKPFLHAAKDYEETCDYIRCMTLDEDIPDEVYQFIPDEVISLVNEYINDTPTATWFGKADAEAKQIEGKSKRVDIITSEIVYYWMIELDIPFECQYWNYNRLMVLIKVIEKKREENDPNAKKKSQREINDYHRAALKANRAARMKSKK